LFNQKIKISTFVRSREIEDDLNATPSRI